MVLPRKRGMVRGSRPSTGAGTRAGIADDAALRPVVNMNNKSVVQTMKTKEQNVTNKTNFNCRVQRVRPSAWHGLWPALRLSPAPRSAPARAHKVILHQFLLAACAAIFLAGQPRLCAQVLVMDDYTTGDVIVTNSHTSPAGVRQNLPGVFGGLRHFLFHKADESSAASISVGSGVLTFNKLAPAGGEDYGWLTYGDVFSVQDLSAYNAFRLTVVSAPDIPFNNSLWIVLSYYNSPTSSVSSFAYVDLPASGIVEIPFSEFASPGSPSPDLTQVQDVQLGLNYLLAPGTYVFDNFQAVGPSTNHPPVADASATETWLVSANGVNATAVFDGSHSYDSDGDALQYFWYSASSQPPTLLTTGVAATTVLPVGSHAIDLVVSDGVATSTNSVSVSVLTTSQAVEWLIEFVDSSGVRNPKPLTATLQAAGASIDRGNSAAAANQLAAFKNKVRAQVGPSQPVVARTLIQAAQQVIDAL